MPYVGYRKSKLYPGPDGTVRVTFEGRPRGMGQMLASEMMWVGVVPHAETIKAKAETLARAGRKYPGSSGRGGHTPYPEAFGVRPRKGRARSNPDNEVDATNRCYAEVYNTNPRAFYLEYGNARLKNPPRALRRAAGLIENA